jgi:hypothetical protein
MPHTELTKGSLAAGAFVTGGVKEYWKCLPIRSTPTTVSELDTGYDLPPKAELLDVRVLVATAEAGGAVRTLDVGLKSSESGGDADGFIADIGVDTAGLKRPAAGIANAANENYFQFTTYGVLLSPLFLQGTDAAGDVGTNYERSHLTDSVTAKSVVYRAGSADWTTFRGAIYLHIREFV